MQSRPQPLFFFNFIEDIYNYVGKAFLQFMRRPPAVKGGCRGACGGRPQAGGQVQC